MNYRISIETEGGSVLVRVEDEVNSSRQLVGTARHLLASSGYSPLEQCAGIEGLARRLDPHGFVRRIGLGRVLRVERIGSAEHNSRAVPTRSDLDQLHRKAARILAADRRAPRRPAGRNRGRR
jgi:hypothetical protein